MTTLFPILLLVACLQICLGFPEFYIHPPYGKEAFAKFTLPAAEPNCLEHPAHEYGPHGAPKVDSLTVLTLTEQHTLNTTASLCLGRSYDAQLSFPHPSARDAILTTATGELQVSDARYNDTACARKRFVLTTEEGVGSFTATLFIPCNTTATSLNLTMTSVEDEHSPFLHWTAAIPIQACGQPSSQCVNTVPVNRSPSSASYFNATAQMEIDAPSTSERGGTVKQSGECAAKQYASTNCTASSLGYSCSLKATDSGTTTTIHYSLGGCPPSNDCTKSAFFPSQISSSETILHMAAVAQTQGYVAMGFAQEPGNMANMDAVVGWMDASGNGSINVFPFGSSGKPKQVYSTNLLAYSGVYRTSAGNTVICFGRMLSSPNATNSATLQPTNLQLNWAVGSESRLTEHDSAGGLTVDIAHGVSTSAGSDVTLLIIVHAVLMLAAWVLLFPLGVLLARHKWVLGEKKLAGIHMWFQAHRGVQVLGFLLTLGGFGLALAKLDAGTTTVGELHKIFGIAVFALTVLQMLAAIPRPSPNTPHRRLWNHFHHWTGRILLASGIATVFIGIVLLHQGDGYAYAPWLIPTCLIFWAFVVTDVLLTVLRKHYVKEDKDGAHAGAQAAVGLVTAGHVSMETKPVDAAAPHYHATAGLGDDAGGNLNPRVLNADVLSNVTHDANGMYVGHDDGGYYYNHNPAAQGGPRRRNDDRV